MMKDKSYCNYEKQLPMSVKDWCLFGCTSGVDDLGPMDEMTKPLYYIIDEVSSQQMNDLAENSKRLEVSRKGNRLDSPEQPTLLSVFRHRISNLIHRRSKRRHDSETASITGVESVVVVNGSDGGKKNSTSTEFESVNMRRINISLKPVKRTWKSLSKTIKSLQRYKPLSRTFPDASTSCGGFHVAQSFESSVGSTEYGTPIILGVTFPHPVFQETMKGRLNTEVLSSRNVWSRCELKSQDDIAPQLTRPFVATGEGGSWGSFASFPTDECDNSFGENMENGSECGSCFDDKPFDEVGTGVSEEGITDCESMFRPYSLVENSSCHESGYFFRDADDGDKSDDESLQWIRRYGTRGIPEFRSEGLCHMLNSSNLFNGTSI
jgi:hypothetical protein